MKEKPDPSALAAAREQAKMADAGYQRRSASFVGVQSAAALGRKPPATDATGNSAQPDSALPPSGLAALWTAGSAKEKPRKDESDGADVLQRLRDMSEAQVRCVFARG